MHSLFALPLRIKTPRLASSKAGNCSPFSLPFLLCAFLERPTTSEPAVLLLVLCFALSLCQTFCLLRRLFLPRRHRRSASSTTALAFDRLLAFRPLSRLRVADSNSPPLSLRISTSPPPRLVKRRRRTSASASLPLSSSNTARSRLFEDTASSTSRTTNSGLTC